MTLTYSPNRLSVTSLFVSVEKAKLDRGKSSSRKTTQMGRRNRPGRTRKAKYVQRHSKKKALFKKKKENLRKVPPELQAVANAWRPNASAKENMSRMGIVYDLHDFGMDVDIKPVIDEVKDDETMCVDIVGSLQRLANKERPKVFHVSEPLHTAGCSKCSFLDFLLFWFCWRNTHFEHPHLLSMMQCVRFIERYGDDYEAMTRDPSNKMQETAAQICRRIKVFRKTAQYQGYLKAKKKGATIG